jgi:hypothetical protein
MNKIQLAFVWNNIVVAKACKTLLPGQLDK